jgi:hypothetical protein
VPATWTGDPAVWVQIEETLALLPIKRRRLLLNYWASGNIADATRRAGYAVKNVKSACEVGREILRDPKVAWCTRAIFEAECGGAEKLRALLAVHAAGFDSPSEGDRDRSLRAASLIYKYGRPRPSADAKPLPEALFDEMSPAELERFAVHREWPARFAPRLRAAGWQIDRSGAAPTLAEAPDVPHDDAAGEGEQPTSATMPAGPPSSEPSAVRAPSEPTCPAEPLARQARPDWQRPEDRVFDPQRAAPEPPIPQPSPRPTTDASALDATDPIAEAKRAAIMRALATRDRRW